MRALRLVRYGEFEMVDLPIPVAKADEVVIRVRACGICGSDVHGMDGSTGRRIPPIVMGHEAAGEIVEVGTDVERWTSGDRVTFDSTIYCGYCPFCARGEINLCDNRQVLGVSCGDYRRDGAFAEYVAVPARVLYRLPDNLTYLRAAMAEPVSVAVHAVRRAAIHEGDRVAVIGVGMIGLLVVQVLRAKGVREIIAVDLDPEKRQLALGLGATSEVEDSSGLDVDAAIEAVGASVTVQMAIRSVRKGGRVALVGNLSPQIEFPLQAVVTRELSLLGCCASQGEYAESLSLIASGAVDVDPMISLSVTLEEAPAAFGRLQRRESGLMKVMVCP